jgi:hypothetical protein
MAVCQHELPRNLDQARFSLGYLVACCIAAPGVDQANAGLLHDPVVRGPALSTTVRRSAAADEDGLVRITVRLRPGDLARYPVNIDGDEFAERLTPRCGPPRTREAVTGAEWWSSR